MHTRTRILGWVLAIGATVAAHAQVPGIALDGREQQIRDRYEQVLQRTPMQDSAFDRVYQSYLSVEGVDAWVKKITPEAGDPTPENLVLLGRIQERQFKTAEAVASLEKARAGGMRDPQLDLLLGRLYFENGQDGKAGTLLTAALEQPLDPEARAGVVRILGSLYLRQGKRDEAIAAWKRLTEDNPDDEFAQIELAEIYEDNRMWAEAVATYTRLAALSANDPYQKCRALRAAGRAHLQLEAYPDAIAAFEQALDLVAPGNWLFEDLKLRLVGVYQDLGDLAGLATYVNEKLMENPGDTEFRDLLAETYTRMAKFDEAEAEHKKILERVPGRAATYERLIALYERQERPEEVAATYEALIAHYPSEPDYLRRLGEVHLRQQAPELAKAAWRRVLDETPTAGQHAQLAEWLEQYEFTAEAVAEYEAALALAPDKEWTFRLAALKHANGEEEVAKALWTSVLTEESSAGERAEVASILETFNFREAAEPILAQAQAQEPDNLDLAHALAKNRMGQEKYAEAAPIFQRLADQTENAYFQERGESGLLDAYSKLGILAEKKEEWESAVREHPEDTDRLMRLARLYARSGDNPGALALYERCVELRPDHADYVHTLAQAYQRENRTGDAIERFQALIAQDPNRAAGYYRELRDIYLKADFKDEAIQTAQKIVELSPTDAEAYLDLGQVYMTYQQYDAGLAAYRSALRLEPDEPNYYQQYGQALQSQQRFGEAQEAYRKMLDAAKEDDTRIQAVNALAQIYQYQGKIDTLVAEFLGRVRNTPKRLSAYEELSAIYAQSGDITQSVEALENGYNAVDDKAGALKSLVRASYDAQDFERVVRYFEDLIALSGKASAYEYDRLGKVYLQLGDVEKAKRTWQRIVEEEPDDPKSYVTLAKALRDGGFYEDAATVTETALDKDPHDYTLRFEYAQELARHEEMGKAYEQLQLLLELGPSEDDQEKARAKEEREKKVNPITRNQANYQRLNMFSPRYRPGQRYYYGNSLRGGTFEGIRPQVIAAMAGMAENSVGLDTFIETYKKRAGENPNSEEAFNDLILIYENTNRMEEAQAATEALAALRPDDVDLLDKLAIQYSANQEVDKALEKLARIDAIEPTRRKEDDLARIYLYYRGERKEEGRALIDRLLQENAGDFMVLNMAINVASQFNETDLIVAMGDKMADLDPRYRSGIQNALARAYTQSGNTEEARKLYETMLFEPDPAAATAYRIPRGNRARIYAPQYGTNNQGGFGSQSIYQLQSQGILSNLDYPRANALDQLTKLLEGDGEAALLQRLQGEVDQFATVESNAARERAWGFGVLYVGHLIVKGELDGARAVLAPFLDGHVDDVSAYNAANYLAEKQEDYGAMLSNYAEMRGQYPSQGRDIARAETATLMLAERYEEAGERIQELARRGLPPNELVDLVQQLKSAEKPALARALLEKQLAGLQRNPQALAMLAEIYAEDNDSERAMELSREAWERQARGGTATNMYFSYGGYYRSSGMSVDGNLRNWYRYAKDAGKGDEVVAEFEERLRKQPGSTSAYEQLASVYTLAGERDKAIDLYKELAGKRPNYVKAQTALAELYEQSGQYSEAIALYETFLKTRPSLYNSMSWQVRRLYQRMGKGEELAKIEEDLVKQARTPDQLQQLAWQFRNSGELEKAADLFEKAMNMQPNQSWYRTQLAEVLQELGKGEAALAVYEKWLESPLTRNQGYIDQNLLAQLVGQYKALGRLGELRTKNDATLADKPDDLIAKSVKAHMAMAEHRFADAESLLLEVIKVRQDPNAVNMLLEMGEYQDKAMDVVERLEGDAQFQNFWDHQRLAQIYLAAGNREKAMERWKQFADQQGNWGLRSVMQGLYDFGLYGEAEAFYLKNRKKARDMDNIAMEMYLEGHGFEALVGEMLQGEVKGLVEGLVESLVNDSRTSYTRGVEVLTPLLERESENKFLLAQMIQLHRRNDAPAEALPFAERALALSPRDNGLRQQYASMLVAVNREEDAFHLYDELLAEKMNAENAGEAMEFYLDQNHLKRAQALRARAAGAIDAKDLEKLDQRLARHASGRGKAREYAVSLRAAFEAERNDANFNTYLQFLLQAGFGEEAYQLCMREAESGLLGSNVLNGGSVFTAAVQFGNLEDVTGLLWNYLRHGERWDRENQLQQAAGSYNNLGYGRQLLDALRARALSEDPPFQALLLPLADRYQEMGDAQPALELLDTLLAAQPGQRALVEKKAAILEGLQRYGEALALRQTMGGAATLAVEGQDQLNLARAYFEAGREAEAMAALDDLTAWNQSSDMAGRVGKLLMNEKHYEAALPYFERGMANVSQRRSVCDDLLRCYLEAGDEANARRVWNENREQRGMKRLYNNVEGDVYRPLAREVYEARLAEEPGDLDTWRKLGAILLEGGDTAGANAAFKRALEAVPPAQTGEVAAGYGALLAKHGQLIPLLEAPPLADPAMLRALARGYTNLPEDQRTAALAEKVLALPLADADDVLRLAAFFNRDETIDAAAAQYQRALAMEGVTEVQQLRALQELAEADALEDATGQVRALLAENPHLLRGNPGLVFFGAKHGDTALVAQGMALLRERLPEEDSLAYYETLAAYFAGDPAALKAFAETARLDESQWRSVAKVFQDAEDQDAEAAVLERIAAGGYGTDSRDRALAELCVIHAEAGRLDEAFARFAQISPEYGDQEGLVRVLSKHLTAADIPRLQAAVAGAAAARPGNLVVPDWAGRTVELAESAGVPLDAETWLASLSLSDSQRAEARQWPLLFEGWLVSPRIPVADREAFMAAEATKADLAEDGAPRDTAGWTFLAPETTLGMVNIGEVLFPEEDDFEQAGAYAWTVVVALRDGEVELTFASNPENVEVWINGERAYTAGHQNHPRPGQERFRVALKAGRNQVVVKTHGNNRRWYFGLGPVSGDAGLAVDLPAPTAIAAAQ